MSNSINAIFNGDANWKKIGPALFLTAAAAFLTGCQDDAQVASHNLSKAADNFEINRRVVFYDGITNDYMLTVEGRCSIVADGRDKQLEVTCKTGEKKFKKHFLGLSDNISYIAEQLDDAEVNTYHHRVTFKPQSIVPDIDFRGDTKQLQKALTPD